MGIKILDLKTDKWKLGCVGKQNPDNNFGGFILC